MMTNTIILILVAVLCIILIAEILILIFVIVARKKNKKEYGLKKSDCNDIRALMRDVYASPLPKTHDTLDIRDERISVRCVYASPEAMRQRARQGDNPSTIVNRLSDQMSEKKEAAISSPDYPLFYATPYNGEDKEFEQYISVEYGSPESYRKLSDDEMDNIIV